MLWIEHKILMFKCFKMSPYYLDCKCFPVLVLCWPGSRINMLAGQKLCYLQVKYLIKMRENNIDIEACCHLGVRI